MPDATHVATDRFSDARISWYRSPIDKARLNALMQRSDARGLLQTLLPLGWFVTTAGIALAVFEGIDAGNWTWHVMLLPLALFVHGTIRPFTCSDAGGSGLPVHS